MPQWIKRQKNTTLYILLLSKSFSLYEHFLTGEIYSALQVFTTLIFESGTEIDLTVF